MRRARPLLGTLVDIRIADDTTVAGRAFEAAFSAVEKVQRLMSAHDAASDVSRINAAVAGATIAVDAWTHQVLARALELHAATDGLFDCRVAPLLQQAGYLPQLGAALPWRPVDDGHDLELLPERKVRLHCPLRITLDGIAKGFAVDQAVAALQAEGIMAGVVNAGGDLRVFGSQAEEIHVRDPAHPGRLVLIGHLRDGAVATSAAYFTRAVHEGRSVSHIFNPRTGEAYLGEASVSILAGDCMTADALTKAMLLDPARIEPKLARLGARAIVLDARRLAA